MSHLWFSLVLLQAVIASLYNGWTYYKPTDTGEKYEVLGNSRIFKSFNLLESYLGNHPDLEVAFFHDKTLNDAKNLGRVTMIEFNIGFTFISRPKLFSEAERLFATLKNYGGLQDFIGFSMFPNNPDSIIFFFSRLNWIEIGRNFGPFALKLIQKRECAYIGIIEEGQSIENSWSAYLEDTGKRVRPEPLLIGNGLKSCSLAVRLMAEAMLNSNEMLKCSIQQVIFFPREELDLVTVSIPFGFIDKILPFCLEKVHESALAPENGLGLENVVKITAAVINAATIDLCFYMRAKAVTGKFNIVDQELITSAFDHFKYSYILDAHFAEDLNPFALVGIPYELSYTIGDDDSTEKIVGFNPMFQDPRQFDMSCVAPSVLLWTSAAYTLWITPQMEHEAAGTYSYRLTLTNVINFRAFLQTFWHEFLANPKYSRMVSTFAFISIRSEDTTGREVEILLEQVESFLQDDVASTRIFLWALFSYLGFELEEVPSVTPTRFKDLGINPKPTPLALDNFDQGFNFKWNIAERIEVPREPISISRHGLTQSYPKPWPIFYAKAAENSTKSCSGSAEIKPIENNFNDKAEHEIITPFSLLPSRTNAAENSAKSCAAFTIIEPMENNFFDNEAKLEITESDDEAVHEGTAPFTIAYGMIEECDDLVEEVFCETVDKQSTEAVSLNSSSSQEDIQVKPVKIGDLLTAAPQRLVPVERTRKWGPKAERFKFLVSHFDDEPVDLSCTHPLQHSWNLFQIDPDYETRQLNVLPINNIEFFWQIMNNLAELCHGYSYAFWKGDGQPMWESPENAGGSRLTNQIKGSNGIGYWAMFLVWLLANQEDKLIEKVSGFLIKRVSGGIYQLTLWYRKGFSQADTTNFELLMNEIREEHKINMNDKWRRKDFEISA